MASGHVLYSGSGTSLQGHKHGQRQMFPTKLTEFSQCSSYCRPAASGLSASMFIIQGCASFGVGHKSVEGKAEKVQTTGFKGFK